MEQRDNPQSRINIREIINKFKPKIDEAENIVTKGRLSPADTTKYRRIRREIAKTLYKRDEEARIDPLTGALSRGELRKKIEEEAARQRRQNHKSSIMFLDFNDLKIINDTRGHAVGDQVLKRGVEILRTMGRETDFVGRWGGDEFVVLLPEADGEGAKAYWNRANEFFQKEKIDLSAGIAELDPTDINFSIVKADEAMYEAKRASKIAGVNTVVVHSQPVS